ncbi:TRAP-type mannitol/chloroaromatic compound transport system, large permease component [Rubellimicrobium thermophilum DSM 16684]|uniref:TRAP-type mannitol/chloroaromatic compound transport system, large permease component n=1 Tax=Rubellimicrobium thermophilum DSM 16684 TaxID=1123069 RepID=S9R213_9RHOB|nr:TRAP-type mannitol/chloroaromatic compound transport system, large permease component [Rubellimicrobium thermophilum DSM 16684]
MIELLAMELAPIMSVSLILFLILGYPAAFALAANGLLFFAIGVWLAPYSNGTITLDWPLLYTMPQRLWGVLSNETLLAIPFFTFMGLILERSGMAEDLLDTVGQLFGPIRGGCLCGDPGGGAAGRHHGRRRRQRDRDGADLPAGDAALRL